VWLLPLRLLQIWHDLLSPGGIHGLLSPSGFLLTPMRWRPSPGSGGGGGGGDSTTEVRWRRRWGGAATTDRWGRGALSICFLFLSILFVESHMYSRHIFAVSSSFNSRQRAICRELVCHEY
jgi:hypothetical protein